jgi:hypothetical protein
MAVYKHVKSASSTPNNYTCLTVDTAAWLAAHIDEPNGSSLRELDGAKRIYEIQDGTWYQL